MESDRSKFVIFAANDVVVIHDVATGLQRFLFGATGKITAISASFPLPHSTTQKVALTPILVAVAQEKPYLIRIPKFLLLLFFTDINIYYKTLV